MNKPHQRQKLREPVADGWGWGQKREVWQCWLQDNPLASGPLQGPEASGQSCFPPQLRGRQQAGSGMVPLRYLEALLRLIFY